MDSISSKILEGSLCRQCTNLFFQTSPTWGELRQNSGPLAIRPKVNTALSTIGSAQGTTKCGGHEGLDANGTGGVAVFFAGSGSQAAVATVAGAERPARKSLWSPALS